MEKKLTMILVCLFLSLGMAFAQTKITGTVVSQDDGEPVIGASIFIQGTKTGTVTDGDGTFSLNVPANKKLRLMHRMLRLTVCQTSAVLLKVVLLVFLFRMYLEHLELLLRSVYVVLLQFMVVQNHYGLLMVL